MASNKNNRTKSWRRGLTMGFSTFLLGIMVAMPSQAVARTMNLVIALPILLIIILTGILFDMIGVAATAADETPFHAMAAKKIPGAKQALRLVRHADRVASFCNDLMGDLAASISGATGAAVIYRLVISYPGVNATAVEVVGVALIAGLTVGGKAIGKAIAIRDANAIIKMVGSFLYRWDMVKSPIFLSGRRKARP